jgi:Tfp pilus assembly protein PilO
MDFFFRTSRISYYLLAIPKGLRSFFTLTLLLLIAILWFFFIYKPMNTTINYYVHSIDQLKTAHAMQEKTIAETTLIQQIICKKQKKLNQVTNAYKKYNSSINDSITLLFDLASKSNLTLCSHSPQDTIQSSWYLTHAFKTEFQGSFNNILNFLEALKKTALAFHMQTFHLYKNDNEVLNLTGTFNLIHLKEDLHEATNTSQI